MTAAALAEADGSLRELAGRVALVTGGAGNIGRAVAVLLAERGASVLVADLPSCEAQAQETVDRCRAAGVEAQLVLFDVTDADAGSVALAAAADVLGWPELLFNNAGYQGDFTPTPAYDPQDFRRILDINVMGVFTVMQMVAQGLIEAGRRGSIVNTASMAGVSGAPNMVAYSASKAAVIAMTKSAAKDLAPHNIRVNAISPAFIGPGMMWERQVQKQAAAGTIYFDPDPEVVATQMINQVPMRRYGSLDEVAEVVLFLLSSRASYLTGTNTEITGGSQ